MTLVEVVLALSLLVVLAGVAVVAYGGWLSSSRFPQAVEDFQTALRMARAESAILGRRLQIAFDGAEGEPRVLIEADPLSEPGQFVHYAGCTWADQLGPQELRAGQWTLTGDSAWALPALTMGDETPPLSLTFHPDGTSDSAEIQLVSTRAGESRSALISLDGLIGTIAVRIVSAEQAEELLDVGPEW